MTVFEFSAHSTLDRFHPRVIYIINVRLAQFSTVNSKTQFNPNPNVP